jgi:hypothetical protein
LRLYDGIAPDPPGSAITTQVMLADIPLALPCGAVANGVLTMTVPVEDGNIPASGTITWGRISDGAGVWVADIDVGLEASGAALELTATEVYQGGIVRVTTGTLTIS